MAETTAKSKALALLNKRDYSRMELIRRLTEKGFEEKDATETVDRLVELHLINDENYAAMIVRHYAAKGFGAQRIREELRRRYIPRELWDDALAQLSGGDQGAYAVLLAKLKTSDPTPDELRRAGDAVRRRGFSWEDTRAAVERFNSERNET